MEIKTNQTTRTKNTARPAKRAYPKSHHKTRSIPKSEARYRILENTMRGYFNYSV